MAAWLAWLRTRLLLPEHDPDARAAREEAEAVRRDLARRAAAQEAADWLDARPQLGRDVFARGAAAAGMREAAGRAAAERDALLRAYTRRIDQVSAAPGQRDVVDAPYRPRPSLLWRAPHALRRIGRLLAEAAGPEAGTDLGADLWCFLPDAEDLAAAVGGAPDAAVPDPALLARSAAASTFVAALELAREGRLTVAQEQDFGAIQVHARNDAPVAS